MQDTKETWVPIPESGRSPGGGNGNPIQYSCLEIPMDRGYSPWGHKESDMTEHTHTVPGNTGSLWVFATGQTFRNS